MDWQEGIALGVVALTVGVFAWRALRPRRFNLQRDTGCGCGSTARPPGLLVQGRKGEKPRISVISR